MILVIMAAMFLVVPPMTIGNAKAFQINDNDGYMTGDQIQQIARKTAWHYAKSLEGPVGDVEWIAVKRFPIPTKRKFLSYYNSGTVASPWWATESSGWPSMTSAFQKVFITLDVMDVLSGHTGLQLECDFTVWVSIRPDKSGRFWIIRGQFMAIDKKKACKVYDMNVL